ncbi:MAG: galactokinase family protein [Melioribacteraceae bacterium]
MKSDLKSLENKFIKIYGNDKIVLDNQFDRYSEIIKKHKKEFGENALHLFSTSGRIEIGGNHTDHNHGRVIAASINLDSIAAVSNNNRNEVKLFSTGFEKPFVIDLNMMDVIEEENGTTNSLVRGVAKGFLEQGYVIGGFDAYMTSNVLIGSGLSSSASIEVLIGTIFSELFNSGDIQNQELAKIGQYAENVFFGKPCGLMDQMACAVGGIIDIDFEDPSKPIVEKNNFDFNSTNYCVVVVNTGGSHADLTNEYASIPGEMKSIAKALNKNVCREISYNDLLKNINMLRTSFGDRAVLRAIHFLQENERVIHLSESLRNNNFKQFLSHINNSGNSSFKYLQNIFSVTNVKEQGISLALALTEKFIEEIGEGACRVHGGGFAGTILSFLPNSKFEKYNEQMQFVFGTDSVSKLDIRNEGTYYLGEV